MKLLLKTIGIFIKLKFKEMWKNDSILTTLVIIGCAVIIHLISHIQFIKMIWINDKGLAQYISRYLLSLITFFLIVFIIGLIIRLITKIIEDFIPWIKDNWKEANKLSGRRK